MMNETDVQRQRLLDQHWRQSEEWIDVYDALAKPELPALLADAPDVIYKLLRKACAMVAEQCRENQRLRNETNP